MQSPRFRCTLLVASLAASSLAAGCSDDEPAVTGGSAATSSSSAVGSGGAGAQGGGASQTGAGGMGGSADGGSGSGASTGVGGGGGSCSAGQGGAGGAVDANDPCATIHAPRVAWITKADPELVITSEVSLLWGFQFVVAVPEGESQNYLLQHVRCAKPAGEVESCDTIDIPLNEPACEVRFAPKYGVDSSQYKEGDNHYSFAIRLLEGCNIVSEEVFATKITYDPT